MKKLLSILICITMIIALVACSNNYDDLSTEEEYAHETSDSESINDLGYSVSPINTSTSFDEIINVWSECLDIDFETCNYINADNEDVSEDYSVSYQNDFQSVLSDMRRSDQLLEAMFGSSYISDPWCFLRGTETDYHITRFLQIEGLRVYEYDDSEWAESAYMEAVDRVGFNYSETIDSSLNQGYCFVIDCHDVHSRFFATYLFNDCIISYSCSINDGERYDLYCSLCDSLDLPTSDVGTEIIHMHAET